MRIWLTPGLCVSRACRFKAVRRRNVWRLKSCRRPPTWREIRLDSRGRWRATTDGVCAFVPWFLLSTLVSKVRLTLQTISPCYSTKHFKVNDLRRFERTEIPSELGRAALGTHRIVIESTIRVRCEAWRLADICAKASCPRKRRTPEPCLAMSTLHACTRNRIVWVSVLWSVTRPCTARRRRNRPRDRSISRRMRVRSRSDPACGDCLPSDRRRPAARGCPSACAGCRTASSDRFPRRMAADRGP